MSREGQQTDTVLRGRPTELGSGRRRRESGLCGRLDGPKDGAGDETGTRTEVSCQSTRTTWGSVWSVRRRGSRVDGNTVSGTGEKTDPDKVASGWGHDRTSAGTRGWYPGDRSRRGVEGGSDRRAETSPSRATGGSVRTRVSGRPTGVVDRKRTHDS